MRFFATVATATALLGVAAANGRDMTPKGGDKGSDKPANNSTAPASYTTLTVTSLETYCPYATTVVNNGKTYTVTEVFKTFPFQNYQILTQVPPRLPPSPSPTALALKPFPSPPPPKPAVPHPQLLQPQPQRPPPSSPCQSPLAALPALQPRPQSPETAPDPTSHPPPHSPLPESPDLPPEPALQSPASPAPLALSTLAQAWVSLGSWLRPLTSCKQLRPSISDMGSTMA